jgi:hypothetical protein
VRDMLTKELIQVYPGSGAEISEVIREALILSLHQKCPIKFVFNDTPVTADANPLVDQIYLYWQSEREK